jgi:hypothetical protein
MKTIRKHLWVDDDDLESIKKYNHIPITVTTAKTNVFKNNIIIEFETHKEKKIEITESQLEEELHNCLINDDFSIILRDLKFELFGDK